MSISTLKISLENEILDWTALQFLVGEINYGGRVTDQWDRRCLITLLKKFICPDALSVPNYKFSQSNLYYVPNDGDIDSYKNYI
jgi:dynein heavy chain